MITLLPRMEVVIAIWYKPRPQQHQIKCAMSMKCMHERRAAVRAAQHAYALCAARAVPLDRARTTARIVLAALLAA